MRPLEDADLDTLERRCHTIQTQKYPIPLPPPYKPMLFVHTDDLLSLIAEVRVARTFAQPAGWTMTAVKEIDAHDLSKVPGEPACGQHGREAGVEPDRVDPPDHQD